MAEPAEIVVPYRPHGSKRDRCLQIVRDHLAGTGLRVNIVDSPGDWSPGAARNAGALTVDAPVVVFNDADTITPYEQIHAAITAATKSPGLVYGYDLYLRLNETTTVAMYATGRDPVFNPDDLQFERELYAPVSAGCCAISLQAFRALHGFDERFLGWGYEDTDFAQRAGRIWPLRRIPGPAYHLWHGGRRADDAPRDSDPDTVEQNLRRLEGQAA